MTEIAKIEADQSLFAHHWANPPGQVLPIREAQKRGVASKPQNCQRSLMPKAQSVKWTREHFLIALNLYCKLPFGNPRNGLCLSSLHDAAFDSGLITLDEKLRVVLSSRLKKYFPQPTLEQNFAAYGGAPIRLPDMLAEPAPEFLRHHRETVFKG